MRRQLFRPVGVASSFATLTLVAPLVSLLVKADALMKIRLSKVPTYLAYLGMCCKEMIRKYNLLIEIPVSPVHVANIIRSSFFSLQQCWNAWSGGR